MSLRKVRGQSAAIDILLGAMKRGRVASSYMFAGEEGVGKRMTAVAFAKTLNCASPITWEGRADACGRCPSCVKIASGSHTDFLMVEPEGGMIKVEEIRRVEEALSFRAHEAKYKTVIIDDAECMNISAANAFLKTLEEPTPGSLIILVTSSPDRLPITIRSRCLRVNFRPLSDTDTASVMDTAGIAGPVALAMGRPGLLVREDMRARRDEFMATLRGMLAEAGKPTWKGRQDMEEWLDMCLMLLRDLAAMQICGNAAGLMNRDIADELESLGGRARLDSLMAGYGKIEKVRAKTLFNLNKGITWNYTQSVLRGAGLSVG